MPKSGNPYGACACVWKLKMLRTKAAIDNRLWAVWKQKNISTH